MIPHPLADADFRGIRDLIFAQVGIHLGESKKSLVSGRLAKRLAQQQVASYRDYLRLIVADATERQVAIDLLTTNETYFFREPGHFDFLANVLAPALPPGRPVRIWCAACSSGEEPYSIAMTLAHVLGHLRFEVVASDISTRVLERAQTALYPLKDAARIPAAMRMAWCLKGIGSQEGQFMIAPALRERVRFEQINLNARLPDVGQFDAIFLRNVMIYFTPETKRDVVARLLPLVRPGGHFIVGMSESLNGISNDVRMVRPSVYATPA